MVDVDVDAVARLRGVIARLSRQLNASATHEGLAIAGVGARSDHLARTVEPR